MYLFPAKTSPFYIPDAYMLQRVYNRHFTKPLERRFKSINHNFPLLGLKEAGRGWVSLLTSFQTASHPDAIWRANSNSHVSEETC